jgi:hypothetical protein
MAFISINNFLNIYLMFLSIAADKVQSQIFTSYRNKGPTALEYGTPHLIATNYYFSPLLAPVQLQISGTFFILWNSPWPNGWLL